MPHRAFREYQRVFLGGKARFQRAWTLKTNLYKCIFVGTKCCVLVPGHVFDFHLCLFCVFVLKMCVPLVVLSVSVE